MAIDIARRTVQTYLNEDQRWLKGGILYAPADSILLDRALFPEASFPNGYIPSGLVLGRVTATGRFGPYGASPSEVQTVNLGAATAGTITITFDGETTGAINFNATAAAVQTALEALSNVNPGDVAVTGGPLPGTITLTFGGRYLGTNVPQVTVTPTGLTGGTVTVATTTEGGGNVTDGRQTARGLLLTSTPYDRTSAGNIGAALAVRCDVITNYLPAGHGLDDAARADLTHMRFFTYNV